MQNKNNVNEAANKKEIKATDCWFDQELISGVGDRNEKKNSSRTAAAAAAALMPCAHHAQKDGEIRNHRRESPPDKLGDW